MQQKLSVLFEKRMICSTAAVSDVAEPVLRPQLGWKSGQMGCHKLFWLDMLRSHLHFVDAQPFSYLKGTSQEQGAHSTTGTEVFLTISSWIISGTSH